MIFLAHGSVLQIIVAVVVTLFFLIGTARIMPYNEFTSNRFKLLTETALLFTLVFPVLLKVNLVKENIDEFQMGILMLVSDTVLPGGGLALAMLYSFIAEGIVELEDDGTEKLETETSEICLHFVNQMHESPDKNPR